ncbi:MAG: GC-type dockerin domain-anchored protein [Phycisphaerales bacterium JB052]
MQYSNTILPLFALAMVPFAATQSHAQSLRCIEEHLIFETQLDQRPISYAMLDNGTLAVLHIDPEAVIRFYDTSHDTLELVGEYIPSSASYRNTIHAHGNDIYACLPASDHPDSQDTIFVIDASDPSNPVLRTEIPVAHNLNLADFEGNTAYFMNDDFIGPGDGFLYVYDITDPDKPIRRRRVNMGLRVPREQGFQVAGGLMHISTYDRINTYSIDEAGQTQWQHAYRFDVNTVWAMEAVGQMLYMGHDGKFEIYDFSDPANPTLRASDYRPSYGRISIDGSTAYVIQNGIGVYDVSNPDAPRLTGHFSDYAGVNGVIPFNDRVLVTRDNGVSIFNQSVKDYQSPEPLTTPTGGEPHEMVIQDNTAYIANGSFRMTIYDLTDPMAPVFLDAVGEGNFSEDYRQIAADEDSIVTASDAGTIGIFTNVDPTQPDHVASISDFVSVTDMDIENNLLAVVGFVEGDSPGVTEGTLGVYDITEPSNPIQRSMLPGFGDPQWVRLTDSSAITYDASSDFDTDHRGLVSFDITDPATPAYVKNISATSGGVSGFSFDQPCPIAFSGQYAYVGIGESISILSSSGPDTFEVLADVLTGYQPDLIHIQGELMIVEANGLYLYDISDPLNPVRVGMANRLEFPTSFAPKPQIVGNAVVALHRDIGLISYEMDTCITCSADLNHDHVLDFFDVSIFLAAYIAQSAEADLNNDGVYDFFDVSDFLVQFNSGCP